MKPNPLLGRTIKDVKVAADHGAILFVTDAGDLIARADGDCCSHTWVENIDPPALGFPALVTAVDYLDLRDDEGSTDEGQVIAFYGCKIATDRGDILIDYRNESNGYYGGTLVWPDDEYDSFYGGVYGQNVSKNEWVSLPIGEPK